MCIICRWTFGGFRLLAVVSNTAEHEGADVPSRLAFSSFTYTARVDHTGILLLNFRVATVRFSAAAAPFCIPPAAHQSSRFSTSSPALAQVVVKPRWARTPDLTGQNLFPDSFPLGLLVGVSHPDGAVYLPDAPQVVPSSPFSFHCPLSGTVI